MNIKQAIEIAIEKSEQPIENIVLIHFVSKDDIQRDLKHFSESGNKQPHMYSLLPKKNSHWYIAFKPKNKDIAIPYVVYLDGEIYQYDFNELLTKE